MRELACSTIVLLGTLGLSTVGLGTLGAAHAAEIPGEWRVEEGVATIRIANCNNRLWGVVASEKTPGGLDSKNPDKAKKNRPTLGMPVLLNMKMDEDEKGKWDGEIYNAKNGKTYEASIKLASPNKLKVEGCVLGILCGGETWTRVLEPAPAPMAANPTPGAHPGTKAPPATGSVPPRTIGQKAPPAGAATPGATAAAPQDPASDICLLPDIARATH
ncbi:DUF2147 domain-containing protein [Afipia carboxidovorans]|uniref:DUF2147 domain-containing protein n=1 Tax=Afipia carboxidovorans TaxID=40137 RepID=UPI00309252AB|nr:DUF2147 domain-containing protein [Afipia carboxidovorans]